MNLPTNTINNQNILACFTGSVSLTTTALNVYTDAHLMTKSTINIDKNSSTKYVMVGTNSTNGVISTSTDGLNYTVVDIITSCTNISYVRYANNIWLAGLDTTSSPIAFSYNAINWYVGSNGISVHRHLKQEIVFSVIICG